MMTNIHIPCIPMVWEDHPYTHPQHKRRGPTRIRNERTYDLETGTLPFAVDLVFHPLTSSTIFIGLHPYTHVVVDRRPYSLLCQAIVHNTPTQSRTQVFTCIWFRDLQHVRATGTHLHIVPELSHLHHTIHFLVSYKSKTGKHLHNTYSRYRTSSEILGHPLAQTYHDTELTNYRCKMDEMLMTITSLTHW